MQENINPEVEKLNSVIKTNNLSAFEVLSKKGQEIFFPYQGIVAQSAQAKGSKIDASIGIALEDDGTPMRLSSISGAVSMDPKQIFPYAPSFGLMDLRQTWLSLLKQKNLNFPLVTSMPVVTAALTHGLALAAYLFVDQGDEIVLTDAYWENYSLLFEQAFGGRLSFFKTFEEQNFNLSGLEQALNSGSEKKILLLNFPNNPAGYTPTEEEASRIVEIVKKAADKGKKIVVICDDAYFGLVYEDGVYKQSLFGELANLSQSVIAVKVDGATKEDYAWGLRVGFITVGYQGMSQEAAKAFEDKLGGIVRGGISNVSNLSQSLVLNALTSDSYQKEKQEKYNILKQRYEQVKQVVNNPEFRLQFTPLPFNSGYFMCLKLRQGLDAELVRKTLIEKYSIGTIAINGLLRIAYSAVPKSKTQELFSAIYNACVDVSK